MKSVEPFYMLHFHCFLLHTEDLEACLVKINQCQNLSDQEKFKLISLTIGLEQAAVNDNSYTV